MSHPYSWEELDDLMDEMIEVLTEYNDTIKSRGIYIYQENLDNSTLINNVINKLNPLSKTVASIQNKIIKGVGLRSTKSKSRPKKTHF